MKMLNRNQYLNILKCNLKSVKKMLCNGCNDCWIRKIVKELDNLSNKEISLLYDNREKFFKFIGEYKYNNRNVCILFDWKMLDARQIIEEFEALCN